MTSTEIEPAGRRRQAVEPAPMLGEREMRVIREQLAPEAQADELEWFAHVANHLGLDPFRNQIVLIGRWDKRLKRKVHRPQVTVDGRRALAEATHELMGIEGPMWCGPRLEHGGQLVWHDVWLDDDAPPYAARVLVYRKGRREPTSNGTAKWSEFVQTDSDGGVLPLWRKMPAHMLGKVAESMALRRAFSDVITGLAVESEFDLIDTDSSESTPPRMPDDSIGYVRDLDQLADSPHAAREPGATVAEGAEPAAPSRPTPTSDHEFVVPAPELVQSVRAALVASGRSSNNDSLTYIGDILGRDRVAWGQLSKRDYERVLIALGVGDEEPY